MAYATIAELAAALRITVTAANQDGLQACLDAAAIEIDHSVDALDGADPDDLLNRVNVLRAVEWFKANDAVAGLGFEQIGTLQAPRGTFARHAATLIPLKEQWGVA